MRIHTLLVGQLMAGVALGCLSGIGSAAMAQTAAPGADTGSSLEEVVVTARKRDEKLIEVPVAVTAYNAAQLSERGIKSISDLQQFAPNFRFQEAGSGGATRGFQVFATRGIFPGSDHPDRQAVTILIDGITVGGGSAIPGLTDVTQVEVVNGPQSAYFGRATFAGAVNFITQTPSNTLKGSAEASVWNAGSFEVQGQIEGPVIKDKLSVRLSGRDWKQGAMFDNYGYGGKIGERETRSAALTLYATPVEGVRLRAYGTKWRDDDGMAAQALLLASDWNCNGGAAAPGSLNYVCGEIGSAPANRISTRPLSTQELLGLRSTSKILGAPFLDHQGLRRDAYFAYISGDVDLPMGFTLTANAQTGDNKWGHIVDLANRYTLTQLRTFYTNFWIKNNSYEVRLASDQSKPLKALFGINHYYQSVTFASTSIRETGLNFGSAPTRSTTDTTGYFGGLTYDIWKLQFSLEGRYQIDDITAASVAPGSKVSKGTTKSFTPRVIAKYKLTDQSNVYVSYAEATRPAQFNANIYALPAANYAEIQAAYNVPLKVNEERLKMYEVGYKGSLLDNRLQVLAAAYWGKWLDRQVSVALFYHDPGLRQIPAVLPSGSVDLHGFELQTVFKPIRSLTLEGNMAYAETKIEKTSCTDCTAITGNPNPVGKRLPRYPAWTGSLSATYERPAFADFTGYIRGDMIYTGKMFSTEANVTWTAPNEKYNLRAGVRNDAYVFELWGKNIFNDKTPTSIARSSDQFASTNTIVLGLSQPATYGIRVGYNF